MEFTSRQLRAFQLVAQHRSFARAAEALFNTPSGLSVLIRELESHLGFRLFDRTTRRDAGDFAGAGCRDVPHWTNCEGFQAVDIGRNNTPGCCQYPAASDPGIPEPRT